MRVWHHLIAITAILIVSGCVPDHTDPAIQSDPAAPTDTDPAAQPEASSEPKETAAAEQPDDSPGLAVGAKAPDFELDDQEGKKRSLKDLLKSSQVALVYYRSADW